MNQQFSNLMQIKSKMNRSLVTWNFTDFTPLDQLEDMSKVLTTFLILEMLALEAAEKGVVPFESLVIDVHKHRDAIRRSTSATSMDPELTEAVKEMFDAYRQIFTPEMCEAIGMNYPSVVLDMEESLLDFSFVLLLKRTLRFKKPFTVTPFVMLSISMLANSPATALMLFADMAAFSFAHDMSPSMLYLTAYEGIPNCDDPFWMQRWDAQKMLGDDMTDNSIDTPFFWRQIEDGINPLSPLAFRCPITDYENHQDLFPALINKYPGFNVVQYLVLEDDQGLETGFLVLSPYTIGQTDFDGDPIMAAVQSCLINEDDKIIGYRRELTDTTIESLVLTN